MRRRDLLAGLAGAAVGGIVGARAQPNDVPRVGFLHSASPDRLMFTVAGVRDGLRDRGYIDGKNVVVEAHWAASDHNRLPSLAADLVRRNVAVIVAGGSVTTRAAKAATETIPIVFITGNPVQDGFANSLSRPGGNLTGVSIASSPLSAKRLDLIRELVPRADPIAFLFHPENPAESGELRELQQAARKAGVTVIPLPAANNAAIDAAFATMAEKRAGALIVGTDVSFNDRREQLVALSKRYALPAIYHSAEIVRSGGLASYGTDFSNAYREAGRYAARILKGAKPADLPILLPTKLELAINLAAAKSFGLEVPRIMLVRASEVVE
jgi:putative tryptophan/tyrosine transport system substrate-binding protein